MKLYPALLLGTALVAGLSSQSAGQSANDLFQQGARAYRRAEFDAAAALFRRSIDFSARDSISLSDRSRTLEYLGAADFYRGSRDSASAVYRRLLQLAPRHKLDDLIFPPEVSGLLDDLRRTVKLVGVEAPRDTTFRAGGRWNARVLATSFHVVAAVVLSSNGVVMRELYYGPIEDTLTLSWDGRDSLDRVVPSGAYVLSLTSTTRGLTVRALSVPLAVGVNRTDTLPVPPAPADSLLLPERARGTPAVRSLVVGLGVGLAAVALPPMLAQGMRPTTARFVLGGAVGIAGIVGFLTHRPSQPLVDNIAANRTRRDQWRARADSIGRENAARRANVRIGIRTGIPSATGSGIP